MNRPFLLPLMLMLSTAQAADYSEQEEEKIVRYWDDREWRCLPYPFESANLLVHLTSLSLNDCNLREVPSLLPPNLTELEVDSNNIEQVREGFSWPSGLQTLNLSWNKLKKVPQGLPDSLIKLRLEKNQIREFPAKLPKALNPLNLKSNHINYVSDKTELPDGLRTIKLQHNGVASRLKILLFEDTINANRSADQRLKIFID